MAEKQQRHETRWRIILFLVIAIFSFVLRTIYAGKLNNSINELEARYVLISYDISKGIFHFPHAPWIMEYDETSFCWLIAPWVLLFGRSWKIFCLFAATVTSLIPSILFLITARKYDLKLGILVGLFFSSVPAQLVWDRDLAMSSMVVHTALWFFALYIVSHSAPRKPCHYALTGLAIGIGTYFAHYNAIVFPTLLALIWFRKDSLKHRLMGMAISITTYFLSCLPLLVLLKFKSEYLLWRQRHFHESPVQSVSIVHQYLSSLAQHLKSLFFGGLESLHLRAEAPVLNPVMAVLFLVGIVFLLRRGWSDFFFVLGLPLTLYIMLGFIKPEHWSGSYHIFAMPFLALSAAFGAYGIWTRVTCQKQNTFSTVLFVIVVVLVVSINVWHFFWGAYRIHPRSDLLTRLQADMRSLEKMPYLFSTAISVEVQHYHMPFWVATRCYQDRISIFGWDNDTWISDPDKVPIDFIRNMENQVGVVVSPEEVDVFIDRFDPESIVDTQILPGSELVMFHCNIDVPDLLQRTWTLSHVPPVLPIKRN
ncbi:MAG: glycosyltransferase family 39 protein [bacterium]